MFEKEAEEYVSNVFNPVQEKFFITRGLVQGHIAVAFKDGAEFGYNKAFVEADKNLKALVADFNKANEWHELENLKNNEINELINKIENLQKYLDTQNCYRECAETWIKLTELEEENTKLKAYNEKLLDGDIEKHNKIVELQAQIEKMKADMIECFGSEYNVLVAKLLNKWEIKEND